MVGKFPGYTKKWCLVSWKCLETPILGDFLPYTLGNLAYFWDSVYSTSGQEYF